MIALIIAITLFVIAAGLYGTASSERSKWRVRAKTAESAVNLLKRNRAQDRRNFNAERDAAKHALALQNQKTDAAGRALQHVSCRLAAKTTEADVLFNEKSAARNALRKVMNLLSDGKISLALERIKEERKTWK